MPDATNSAAKSASLRQGTLAPKPDLESEISFSACIDRIFFKNDDNGYAVLRVTPDGKDAGRNGVPLQQLTCVGTLLNPREGQRLRFTGKFVRNPKFGRQFQFVSANEQVPSSTEGLVAYLSSNLIKGLGRDTALRVVEKFGDDTLRILDEEPERLAEVKGIGQKNLATIAQSWREHRSLSDLMQFLQPQGISAAYGVRIFKEYGAKALDIVRENPYRLAMDISGIGFLTADAIAEKLGFAKDNPLRMQGAALYILQRAAENGDVFLPLPELTARVEKELGIAGDAVLPAIERLEADERIVVDTQVLLPDENNGRGGDKAVYLSLYHRCESRTAYYLERLCHFPSNVTFKNRDAQVEKALKSQGFELAEAQAQAVRQAARSKVMVLTGGPGTGKTTIIKAIIALYEQVTSRIYLAAPTGRAAKRMAEATEREARTLHRMLEYNPATNKFNRNENEPLACDLLIVDEASMMDILIFHSLLKAVPTGCVVILVGDIHQLPSVGPGAVLADIIASGKVPVSELSVIFRQAQTSAIVANAHRINRGEVPVLPEPWDEDTDFYFLPCVDMEVAASILVDLVCREIPQRYGYDPVRDVQFMTPMHKGEVGTVQMNTLLQQTLNPGTGGRMQALPGLGARGRQAAARSSGQGEIRRGEMVFRCGDKVMQIRNNYDKDVFNGDVGFVVDIDTERKLLRVVFDDKEADYGPEDLDELVLAYAISIHKSQGSEYPAVVVPLFMQHYIMLQRNLIYTAITRGKKLVVLVGDPRALEKAVRTANVKRRYTRLAWRLQEYVAEPARA